MIDLSHRTDIVAKAPLVRAEGKVDKVVGLLVEVSGLKAALGRELEVGGDPFSSPTQKLTLEVIGFRDGKLLAAPLGPTAGISPGTRVRLRTSEASAEVGDALLGRVLDAFGKPLDSRPAPRAFGRAPLSNQPPQPFARRPIDTPLGTGVRAIDSALAFGESFLDGFEVAHVIHRHGMDDQSFPG